MSVPRGCYSNCRQAGRGVIDEVHSTELLRRPSVAGAVLVVLAALVGLMSAPQTETAGATTTYMGCSLIFIPVAFGFGLIVVPLLAKAANPSDEGLGYFWVLSGLGPLALLLAAFTTTVVLRQPDWGYLANAACPLGISISLAFRRNPLESNRNIL